MLWSVLDFLTGNDGPGLMVEGQTFTIGENFIIKIHVVNDIHFNFNDAFSCEINV